MKFKVVHTFVDSGMTYGEDLLGSLGAVMVAGRWVSEDDLIANAKDADAVVCVSPAQNWTPRVLTALSRCRIVATLSIGYDRIPLDAATKMGIVVTNVPDYCIDEVSNQAISLMMALGRKLIQIDRAVRERQIHLTPGNRTGLAEVANPIFRLRGQTLGIIGFGKIGTAVALKAKGLGLKVIAYDPYVLGAVLLSHGVEPVDLNTLLCQSDFISVNAVLTGETKGMIGPGQFKKMKPTCYLVNTARGGIIQQAPLVEALERRLIAGAGLDVTADEPIPPGDPILKLSNVILTGHSAWYSVTSDSGPEYWHKPVAQVAMALKGEWPTYAVNPEVRQKWLERWGEKGGGKEKKKEG